MRDVAGKASTVAGLQIVSLAATTIPTRPSRQVKYSRVPGDAACRQPSAGREIHDDHHPVRHRLGDQRPLGYALASLREPISSAAIGAPWHGREEQLIDRHASAPAHLDEDSQGGVGRARFPDGDRRARQRDAAASASWVSVRACRRLIRLRAR